MSDETDIFSEDDDELWGGQENEVIIPAGSILAAILGPHLHPGSPQLQSLPPPPLPLQSGRVRRREEADAAPVAKSFKGSTGKRIVRDRTPDYSYLRLKSGEEFIFTEEDGKRLLLPESMESNRLIRNIVSKMPKKVSERLEYLAKFRSEEEEEEEEYSDEEKKEEEDDENRKKVQKRYLGDLKESVYAAFIKELRLRFIFKKLLIQWRVNKMNKTAEKEVDPITLSEPEKEVYLYDWSNKRKFIFDAKSLATMIETNLMYQEYAFAVPILPRNPKNNVDFSYGQLVSLYYQLKDHGELRWGLATLREYNFNKNRWHMYHRSALTLNAIKTSITTLETFEAKELLSDFIFAKMDDLGLRYNNYTYNIYQVAMASVPKHWYLEKLKGLAIMHYEAEHFGHNRSKLINANCLKLFRKQTQFINDLKTKNII